MNTALPWLLLANRAWGPRDDVTSYSHYCFRCMLRILIRCTPHAAEEWEWHFHILDANNVLS